MGSISFIKKIERQNIFIRKTIKLLGPIFAYLLGSFGKIIMYLSGFIAQLLQFVGKDVL